MRRVPLTCHAVLTLALWLTVLGVAAGYNAFRWWTRDPGAPSPPRWPVVVEGAIPLHASPYMAHDKKN